MGGVRILCIRSKKDFKKFKNILLEKIRLKSEREARYLAGEFARAASEEKEKILAALELQQWLAAGCLECAADREGEAGRYCDRI